MGQTTDQIVSDIDQTRDDLRLNIEELEMRLKDAANWRSHFKKQPGPMIVAAVIGGALLSALIGRR